MTRRKVISGAVGSRCISFSATITWAELETGRSSAAPWIRPRMTIWRRLGAGIGRSDRDGLEGLELPERLLVLGRELVEALDLRLAEEQAAGRGGFLGPLRLELAGQHGLVVAVAEDVGD